MLQAIQHLSFVNENKKITQSYLVVLYLFSELTLSAICREWAPLSVQQAELFREVCVSLHINLASKTNKISTH